MSAPAILRIELPAPLCAVPPVLRALGKEYPEAVIVIDGPDYRPGFMTLRLGPWTPPADEDFD